MKIYMNRKISAAAIVVLLTSFQHTPVLAEEGNVDAGKSAFKSCAACHKIGEGAKNSAGPVLNGIVGRTAGTVEGFKYGKHLTSAGKQGLVWTPVELNKWLLNPKKYLRSYLDNKRAKSKMNAKVKNDQKRADLIVYLETLRE